MPAQIPEYRSGGLLLAPVPTSVVADAAEKLVRLVLYENDAEEAVLAELSAATVDFEEA